MGLLDLNKRGGLFGPPEYYGTPGIGDGLPGARPIGGQIGGAEMFDDVNTPYGGDQPEKRGGVFGSGYNGEDIMSMLLRAAAIAQGDLDAGAKFGANIGAKARAEAEAAQKRQAALQDYEAERQIDQRYEAPPAPPAIVRNLEAFQNFTPQQRRAFEQYQALVNPRYMTGADKLPYQTNAAPLDLNEWEPVEPQGGGASNGTGGF